MEIYLTPYQVEALESFAILLVLYGTMAIVTIWYGRDSMSKNLMAKKNYNITEITRLLLKMRDNCVQKEGEMYNDPERQEKYEALQAAIDLINNPSRLIKIKKKGKKN